MNMEVFKISIEEGFYTVMSQLADFLPLLLAFTLILVLGYLIAKLASKIVLYASKKFRLDEHFESFIYIQDERGQDLEKQMALADKPFSKAVGLLSFYGVFLVFIKTGLEVLQLSSLSSGLGALLSFVPNIIVAGIILLATYTLAQFVKTNAMHRLNLEEPYFTGLIGTSAFVCIMVLGSVFAASQLSLDMTLLTSIIQILMIVLCVVVTLAFGLGCRPLAKSLISGFYLKNTFRNTNYVSIQGEVGRVIAVGPLYTHISRPDGSDTFIPNEQIVNQKISTYSNLKNAGVDDMYKPIQRSRFKKHKEQLSYN